MRRFFRLGRVKDLEHEVDEELAFHLEQQTQALIVGGMDPGEAREEATRRLGDLASVRKYLVHVDRRDAQRRTILEHLHDWRLDLRFAIRSLVRTPGPVISVVVLLGVGLGINTAMLGIMDRTLLRPPPGLADADHLVRVGVLTTVYAQGRFVETISSYLDVADYQRGIPEFQSVAGYNGPRAESYGADSAGTVSQSVVSPEFFRTLGSAPRLGRTFDSTDESGPPVAVVGYDMWRSRLGGRESALGTDIVVDGRAYRVIGVMPAGFSGVEFGATDVWVMAPQAGWPDMYLEDRRVQAFVIIARLREGADPEVTAQHVAALRRSLFDKRPARPETMRLLSIVPGRWLIGERGSGMRLSVLIAAVSLLLLLITVANVAHVMLVRAASRQREFAVRTALGAGWKRLLRLVLAESLVVAAVSGLIAAVTAPICGKLLRGLIWPGTTWSTAPVSLLSWVVATLLALSIGVVAGLVPALLARSGNSVAALRTGIQAGRGWRGGLRLPLVTLQVAVSVVLIGSAALFALSLRRIGTADHGLDLRHLINAHVNLDSTAAWRSQLDAVESAVSRIPGVTGVTASFTAPYRGFTFERVRGHPGDSALGAMYIVADAGFFRSSGLRIEQGREFGPDDVYGSAPVAIVNDVLATHLWPHRSPIGQCLYQEGMSDAKNVPGCTRVVGVAAQARMIQLKDEKDAQLYVPLNQVELLSTTQRSVELYVRTACDPERAVERVGRTLARVLRTSRTVRVKSFNDLMSSDIRPWRVSVLLFGIAAVLAAALAALGLYTVMAFDVRQRYHEIGVRRALGAQAGHILRVLGGRSWSMVAAGAVVGIAALLYAGRFVAPLLFETSPYDPLAIAWPVIALLATGAVASIAPALVALRINPRDALQAD